MLNDLGLIFSHLVFIAKYKNICSLFLSLIYELSKKNIFYTNSMLISLLITY